MLSVTYRTALGTAKLNQIRMMRDRGFALPPHEAALLAVEADPAAVVAVFAQHACAAGCSLGEAMGCTYVAPATTDAATPHAHPAASVLHPLQQAPAAQSTQPQQPPPPPTTVAFLDQLFDVARGHAKKASMDQVRAVLDAVRAADAARRLSSLPPSTSTHTRAVDSLAPAAALLPPSNVLLIAPQALSPEARREIVDIGVAGEGGSASRTAAGDALRVRVMLLEDLAVPVAEHMQVPAHVRLSPTEAAAVLRACKVTLGQLPHMPDTDPLAVYFDFREGDVVRATDTRTGAVSYRVVVRDIGG